MTKTMTTSTPTGPGNWLMRHHGTTIPVHVIERNGAFLFETRNGEIHSLSAAAGAQWQRDDCDNFHSAGHDEPDRFLARKSDSDCANHRQPAGWVPLHEEDVRSVELVGSIILVIAIGVLIAVSSEWAIWIMIAAAASLLTIGTAYVVMQWCGRRE